MANAPETALWDNLGMARRTSTPPRKLKHQWFLAEWAEQAGKTQADAVRELGWNKSTASHLWNGVQRYNQDLIEDVSAWLNVMPYELLLPVEAAMGIRQMRSSAVTIVATTPPDRAPRAPHTHDENPRQPKRITG